MADAPMERSKPSQEYITDPRFEFDAPRYYDFARGSPESEGHPDDWFGNAKATAGLKSPPDQEKDENNENAPPASGSKSAAKSLNGKLEAADPTQSGRCRPVLAPIENSVPQASSVVASAPDEAYQEEQHDAEPISGHRSDHGKQPVLVPAAQCIEHNQNCGEDETVDASSEPDPKPLCVMGGQLPTKKAMGRVTGKATRDLVHQQEQHLPEHENNDAKEHHVSNQVKKRALGSGKAILPTTKPRSHAMRTRSLAKEPAPEENASPWRSRSEKIAEFEGRLMTRPKGGYATHGFRPAAAGTTVPTTTASGSSNAPGSLTLPHSPALQTRKRARPPRFKPREEVEAEEMAALPPFKARPFRKSMFSEEARHKGVPAAPSRSTTTQEPFDLVTDQRAYARAARG